MKNISILMFVFYFFLSCNKQENIHNSTLVPEFNNQIELIGKEILINEPIKLYTSFLDSLLFFVSDRDTIFHLYKKNEDHVVSFGLKGRGPGEFITPPVISDVIADEHSSKALVIDHIRKELTAINVTSSIENKEINIDNVYEIPRELFGLRNVFYATNNSFIGVYDDRDNMRLNSKSGIFYYDTRQGITETFPLLNLNMEPTGSREIVLQEMNLNARTSGVSWQKKKLAVALRYVPIVEIFDIESKQSERYLLDPNPPIEPFSVEDFGNRNVIEYFRNIYVTDDAIYLLFCGYPPNESQLGQKIMVMDWTGLPIVQYSISEHYDLSRIMVDEENKIIYGTSYPNGAIYTFNY